MWTKKHKDRILNLVKKWKTKLYLDAWDIRVSFSKIPHRKNTSIAAEIDCQPEYMQGFIMCYPLILDKPEEIEMNIRHELCHAIVSPLMEIVIDLYDGRLIDPHSQRKAHELVTSHVERIANI